MNPRHPFCAGIAVVGLTLMSAAPALAQDADLLVQDIGSATRFGPDAGFVAFACGLSTCNVGSASASWTTAQGTYPLFTQNLYRLENGRLEQVGMMWAQHNRICALNLPGACGACDGPPGCAPSLAPGCFNSNSGPSIGTPQNLGLRSEVNPWVAAAPLPFTISGLAGSPVASRLQAAIVDLEPKIHPSAKYFVEAVVVSPNESAAARDNNASYRLFTLSGAGGNFSLIPSPGNSSIVGSPAIFAWQQADPSVMMSSGNLPEDGNYYVASRVRRIGFSTWVYDYAVYNANAARPASSLRILTGLAGATSPYFHDVQYHSGDPVISLGWDFHLGDAIVAWEADLSPGLDHANLLRWATLYNFGFTSDQPPVRGDGQVVLTFADGQALSFAAKTPDPDGFISGDTNCDSVISVSDIGPFVQLLTDPDAFFTGFPNCHPLAADCSGDGNVSVSDIGCFVQLLIQ